MWRFKEQIDQGGVLEIVISDQLAVNDVIRHVLIKISSNRSGPFGGIARKGQFLYE